MDRYQYMFITVGAIFCVLLLVGFSILVQLTFKEEKMIKKVAPCPDYWEEVKNVRVVDVNPNKNFIYKGDTKFDISKNIIIGNNSVQYQRIMVDTDTPLIRINNEVTKKITACKVPSSGGINIGNIYSGNIQLRNYRYGLKYNNLRGNYTTQNIIPTTGANINVNYDKKTNIYTLTTPGGNIIAGDNLSNSILTPGFYWKADCSSNENICLSGKDDGNVKIWGISYDRTLYTPSEFYIDFKHDDWHAYNMHKSKKCNLKNWANTNGIVWDGITNVDC